MEIKLKARRENEEVNFIKVPGRIGHLSSQSDCGFSKSPGHFSRVRSKGFWEMRAGIFPVT